MDNGKHAHPPLTAPESVVRHALRSPNRPSQSQMAGSRNISARFSLIFVRNENPPLETLVSCVFPTFILLPIHSENVERVSYM